MIPIRLQVEDEEEEELFLGLFFVMMVQIGALMFAYMLRVSRWTWTTDSMSFVLFGMILGIIARIGHIEPLDLSVRFSNDIFIIVLLPPVIFYSGFSLKKTAFFRNIVNITVFAIPGTLLSSMMVALMVWGLGQAGWYGDLQVSFVEAAIFASLISATDPVATMVTLRELNVEVNLGVLVFGESLVNDAIALVLYKAMFRFLDPSDATTGMLIGLAIYRFIVVLVGSVSIGAIFGACSALMLKKLNFRDSPPLENLTLLAWSYAAYLLVEGIGLSGIVSVLTCGIVMRHYTFNNMSPEGQASSVVMFHTISDVAESIMFIYLGAALFAIKHEWNFGLIAVCLVVTLLGRVLSVSFLTGLINLIRKPTSSKRVKKVDMFVLCYAGLRGAISFALAVSVPTANNDEFLAATLIIILFTIAVLGSTSNAVFAHIGIPRASDQPVVGELPDKDKPVQPFIRFDRQYIKPFLTHYQAPEAAPASAEELLDGMGSGMFGSPPPSLMFSRNAGKGDAEASALFDPTTGGAAATTTRKRGSQRSQRGSKGSRGSNRKR